MIYLTKTWLLYVNNFLQREIINCTHHFHPNRWLSLMLKNYLWALTRPSVFDHLLSLHLQVCRCSLRSAILVYSPNQWPKKCWKKITIIYSTIMMLKSKIMNRKCWTSLHHLSPNLGSAMFVVYLAFFIISGLTSKKSFLNFSSHSFGVIFFLIWKSGSF